MLLVTFHSGSTSGERRFRWIDFHLHGCAEFGVYAARIFERHAIRRERPEYV